MRGTVGGIDAGHRQTVGVLLDQQPFTAARIEHARRRWQAVEIRAHDPQLGPVRRVVVPVRVKAAVIVAAQRVLALPQRLIESHQRIVAPRRRCIMRNVAATTR